MGTRFENTGATLAVFGLVIWYLGGSRSIFRLLSTQPLLILSLLLVLLSFGVAFAFDRRGVKLAFRAGVMLAAGSVLCMWSALAMLNVLFDRSEPELVPSQIVSFHKPNKGPRQVTVVWNSKRESLDADHAEGCAKGETAVLYVHDGVLGMPWVDKVICPDGTGPNAEP